MYLIFDEYSNVFFSLRQIGAESEGCSIPPPPSRRWKIQGPSSARARASLQHLANSGCLWLRRVDFDQTVFSHQSGGVGQSPSLAPSPCRIPPLHVSCAFFVFQPFSSSPIPSSFRLLSASILPNSLVSYPIPSSPPPLLELMRVLRVVPSSCPLPVRVAGSTRNSRGGGATTGRGAVLVRQRPACGERRGR